MKLKRLWSQGLSVTIAWRWWALALVVTMADLLTKLAVSTLMPYGQSIPLTGFCNLVPCNSWGFVGLRRDFLCQQGVLYAA